LLPEKDLGHDPHFGCRPSGWIVPFREGVDNIRVSPLNFAPPE